MSPLETMALDTEVLIIGAGPTGLTLAISLLRAGVTPMIVDKLPTGQNTSRAAVIHAHTLEVLDRVGVAEQLVRKGRKLTKFSIRDRDHALVRLNFDSLPTQRAYLLMLPQDETERTLESELNTAGGEVHRGCTVESLREDRDGIHAAIVSTQGKQTIRARYVVGADGMHSLVRQSAGIGFTGSSYEESFVLADVEMNWRLATDEVMLFFTPAGPVVVAPLPSGAFRIVATLDNAPEHPTARDMQAILDSHGPTHAECKISRVLWSSRFRLHHRVADHYRRGRFLLMGDAAHVHSPAGGQGMNTGLVDACVLGPLLAGVVSGIRGEGALDRYETLRRPAAMQVLQLAGTLTNMATMKSAPKRWLRNAALSTINRLPLARRRLAMNLSGLSRRRSAGLSQ